MLIFRQRARDAALLVLGGAFGAGIALLGAREVQIRFSEEALLNYSRGLLRIAESAAQETRNAVQQFSSDNLPFCSDQELADMRRFVYNAAFVKDLGREKDGLLYCTSGLGRIDKPARLRIPALSFLTPDRAFQSDVFPENNLLLAPDSSGIVMVADGVTAVINPALLAQLDNPPMQATGLIYDHQHQVVVHAFGHPDSLPASEVLAQRMVEHAGVYYQPLCSRRYSVCVIAAESRHDMLTFHPGYFVSYSISASLFSALGALLGILSVLTVLLFIHRQRSLERRLRRAVNRRQLTCVYQPIVNLESGEIVAAEGLARWTDEDGESVSPEVFIPVAENAGFIGNLTSLVIENVLDDLGTLLVRDRLQVSLNIFAADLTDERFFPHLEECLRRSSVPPASLGFEITEHATALKDDAIAAIARLRAAGHLVYVDDFGTGYSSLAYLHDLHADAIKIDRAFTKTIGTEAVTASVVPQILDMACRLGLKVTVEGIETEQQAAYFRAACADVQGQGWLFGKPVPAAEFIALFESHAAGDARQKQG